MTDYEKQLFDKLKGHINEWKKYDNLLDIIDFLLRNNYELRGIDTGEPKYTVHFDYITEDTVIVDDALNLDLFFDDEIIKWYCGEDGTKYWKFEDAAENEDWSQLAPHIKAVIPSLWLFGDERIYSEEDEKIREELEKYGEDKMAEYFRREKQMGE